MDRHRLSRMCLFLLVCLLPLMFLACGESPVVTVGGTPVTNEAFITAVRLVHSAEAVSVSIGGFLIQRHHDRCGHLAPNEKLVDPPCVKATAILKENATTYAPPILIALTTARDVLRLVSTAPETTSQAKINQALTTLTQAVNQSTSWAARQGWISPIATP